jgi:hypothetical protein
MKAIVRMSPEVIRELMEHLLPEGGACEEAAFLYANFHINDFIYFEICAVDKLLPSDFDVRECDYLQLKDATRARLIKRAHDLNASLIEIHSHLGPWTAAFSEADTIGLTETVPQLWWRLSKRPYIAIVVAHSGFDALVWLDDPKIPQALEAIVVGDQTLKPTNQSLRRWT